MSLVGFSAQNHPQQERRDDVDDRWTPLNLWIPWNARWDFTVDVAASDENHLCDRYYTLADDGLERSWAGERVWCNPPFSNVAAWVAKAWREWLAERAPELIVMLVPANRTEQRWWQEDVEPLRDRAGSDLSTEFLPRRINFASRDNLGAWYSSSAPFGCVLLIWHPSPQESPTT